MEILERYCSYKVSKLLKEKKFKEKVRALWIGDTDPYFSANNIKCDDYNSGGTDLCSAPTHQMALAWLRENGWHIEIALIYNDDYKAVYYPIIANTKDFLIDDNYMNYKYFLTVEEATEAAILYCLKELI